MDGWISPKPDQNLLWVKAGEKYGAARAMGTWVVCLEVGLLSWRVVMFSRHRLYQGTDRSGALE